jgi:multimeric flavodoxin WrbA
MHYLLINGSPRKNGASSKISKIIKEELNKHNHIITEMNSYDLHVKACIGCLQCRPYKTCVLPEDDGHKFARELSMTDVVIIVTPTYWGNMTAKTRMLFERAVPTLEYIDGLKIKKMLKGKKAIIITCCSAPFPFYYLKNQANTAIHAIKNILTAGGIKVVKTAIIGNTNNIEFNAKFIQKISKMIKKIA